MVSKLVVPKPSGQYQKQLQAAKAASEATRCGQAVWQEAWDSGAVPDGGDSHSTRQCPHPLVDTAVFPNLTF